MSCPNPTPAAIDPLPADAPTLARALILRQLARLDRLAEIGMEIAEAAGLLAKAQAEGGQAGASTPDPGLTFTRAARAVRLTIALQSRLAKDLARFDGAAESDRKTELARRRGRIHHLVERAIEADLDDEDEIERLSSDAWERLTDEDDDVLADAPLAEVVARICRDLGLAPEWGGQAFADLAPVGVWSPEPPEVAKRPWDRRGRSWQDRNPRPSTGSG